MTPLEHALSDLLWTTLPFRNVVKGETRANFIAAWAAGTAALTKGRFKAEEEAVQNPRAAAVEMFRHTLAACAALGVKPHELTPLFNDKADGGFLAAGDPLDALTLLGRSAARTARLTLEAKKEDAA